MKKKSLIMLVCALVVLSGVAFGTIAYLTDRESVTNRFTIGNVDISVDETKVDKYGNPEYPENTLFNPDGTPVDPAVLPLRTEQENEYALIPGSEYVKDPTLTVKAGSERAYVRMVVTVTCASELKQMFTELAALYPEKYPHGFLSEEHVAGWDSAVWPCVSMQEDAVLNTLTLEFRYFETVEPADAEDMVLPALFKTLKVPGELIYEHLQKLQNLVIDVQGHAIQAAGFADADAAWAAFPAADPIIQTQQADNAAGV